MKKLILSELLLLFLATTFMTDSLPPGWYQQSLPVNDQINDLFFIDSLNGWVVTDGTNFSNDTAYVMHTTDGGNSWTVQLNQPLKLNAIQFLNLYTGYASGGNGTGTGRVLKTTNSGLNWFAVSIFSLLFNDLFFVNADTGWVCDAASGFGGLYKTTNGGINWQQQLGASYTPSRLFFLNNDTGWVTCNNYKLYKTTNSGVNWNQIYDFGSNSINYQFFVNGQTGWITGGPTGLYKSINGGFNWDTVHTGFGYNVSKMFFFNDKKGWVGYFTNKILATTDGDTWGYQNSPSYQNISVHFVDSLKGWGGTEMLVHTIDGGGQINAIQQISSEVPTGFKLYQNYPNPFNPVTKIKYQIVNSKEQIPNTKLVIYDIQGKEITTLVNEVQRAGTYEVDFDGTGLASGVFFYQLTISNGQSAIIYSETKKMILLK